MEIDHDGYEEKEKRHTKAYILLFIVNFWHEESFELGIPPKKDLQKLEK